MHGPGPRAIAVAAALTLCSCGGVASAPPAPGGGASTPAGASAIAVPTGPVAPFTFWARTTAPAPDGSLLLLGSDGTLIHDFGAAVPLSDGSAVVATTQLAGVTRVQLLDTSSQAVRGTWMLSGALHLAGIGPVRMPIAVAPGDGYAVLQSALPGEPSPGKGAQTRLAVVDLAHGGVQRVLDLPGDLSADALSADGRVMDVIETLPPDSSGAVQYHVRQVDVPAGSIDPRVIVDKVDPEPSMSGTALSRVQGSGGEWALTAYAFGRSGPFVHALNVDGGWALCIDLPFPASSAAGAEQQLLWSLVRDPSGHFALAVNAATGEIASLRFAGGGPELDRHATLAAARPQEPSGGLVIQAQAKRLVSTAAAISPDGTTLYAVAEDGVLVVDVGTLTRTRTIAAGQRLTAIHLSPDGRALVGVLDGGTQLVEIRTDTGAVILLAAGGSRVVDALLAAPGPAPR